MAGVKLALAISCWLLVTPGVASAQAQLPKPLPPIDTDRPDLTDATTEGADPECMRRERLDGLQLAAARFILGARERSPGPHSRRLRPFQVTR